MHLMMCFSDLNLYNKEVSGKYYDGENARKGRRLSAAYLMAGMRWKRGYF